MKNTLGRLTLGAVVVLGCLFAGPCGITTLQFQDFLTSSLIRTGTSTFFSLLEAATVEAGEESVSGAGGAG